MHEHGPVGSERGMAQPRDRARPRGSLFAGRHGLGRSWGGGGEEGARRMGAGAEGAGRMRAQVFLSGRHIRRHPPLIGSSIGRARIGGH